MSCCCSCPYHRYLFYDMATLCVDSRPSLRKTGFLFLKASIILVLLFHLAQTTRLYSEEDLVVILTSSTIKQSLLNSSTAWLVQFYSSWCGHCIQYSPTWKALARDVQDDLQIYLPVVLNNRSALDPLHNSIQDIKLWLSQNFLHLNEDWEQAIRIGVLDCAQENNFDICKDFGVHFYPTFRYFKAHNPAFDVGQTNRGADRELQTVRQLMVNFLQNHTKQDWPASCPALEPSSSENILSLIGQKSDQYTAIIVENEDSYIGREVILDLMTYQGLTVKRALSSDKRLIEKLGINSFPSAYLLHPNGTHDILDVQKRLRFFFSSFLKLLPGVHRKQNGSGAAQEPLIKGPQDPGISEAWKDFEKSKVYMADLESGLHYLLRVELATHQTLVGEELKTFKVFVTVVAKLFPGRHSVVKLLETLLEWLISLPLEKIPYDAILDLVNNKMRISGMFLSNQLQWVGCQGSRVGLRGYPCSLWTLFHVLTVQAARQPDALANTGLEENPKAVLQTMRMYIVSFFGCQECGKHFEEMAAESLSQVKSLDQAVLWLWRKHNQVNGRLAGTMSEDPHFPKTQWPSPDLCPTCHEEQDGIHVWNEDKVLAFLKQHYGAANISPKHLHSSYPKPPAADRALKPNQEMLGHPESKPIEPIPGKTVAPESSVLPANHAKQSRVEGAGQAGIGAHNDIRPGVSFLGLGFSNLDMSLCVVLYAFSCVFLMFMFFFFRVRSKRWKVRYNRPYV
ncbi:sulfhydryl oxidase 2 isoform X2 [Esox lucius]|uniref:Sulfhydryl oxidase n=1 Tax=Esox lucius TaxID=8010 RepID=A0AAY5K6L7_ESOLU|nr:sulfhydryl oxidase 2 isoform X2 [Esox lucius]